MTAIINDLLFKLHFLCIPMRLESVAEFDARMDGMADDEAEQQLQKLTDTIMGAMSTKEAIHDALPSDLLDVLNNSYIHHLSPLIDYLGCKEDQPEWVNYQSAFSTYCKEVEEALAEKAASVVTDSTSDMTESSDLKEINDHLVVKWEWMSKKGIFDGNKWSTSTGVPLLSTTFIKNLDFMVQPVCPAFEQVRTSKPVEIYVF